MKWGLEAERCAIELECLDAERGLRPEFVILPLIVMKADVSTSIEALYKSAAFAGPLSSRP